jgi:hypothetical protein
MGFDVRKEEQHLKAVAWIPPGTGWNSPWAGRVNQFPTGTAMPRAGKNRFPGLSVQQQPSIRIHDLSWTISPRQQE